MWRPKDEWGEGPFVPECSFCGRVLHVIGMESKEVRGVTRYFCPGGEHSRLYEEMGEKTLARKRILHNSDPVGDAFLEMWLVCVRSLRVNPGA